jgi:hypothetical protein
MAGCQKYGLLVPCNQYVQQPPIKTHSLWCQPLTPKTLLKHIHITDYNSVPKVVHGTERVNTCYPLVSPLWAAGGGVDLQSNLDMQIFGIGCTLPCTVAMHSDVAPVMQGWMDGCWVYGLLIPHIRPTSTHQKTLFTLVNLALLHSTQDIKIKWTLSVHKLYK